MLLFFNVLCVAFYSTCFALDDLIDPMRSLRIMEDRILCRPSTIYVDPKLNPRSKCGGTGKILTTLKFVTLNEVVSE